jgi:hypothetical protein
MAVVAHENPLSGGAGVIREHHQNGKVRLLCTPGEQTDEYVSTNVIAGA